MNPLPKIARILEITPYKITLLWNTSEIRVLDFAPLLDQWDMEGDKKLGTLRDWDIFRRVTLSENNTLSWPDLRVEFIFKGAIHSTALELDALQLYKHSTLIKKIQPIQLGAMLRNAREAAGLTQASVAQKSGTTRHYISRIENDKTDIQLETLQKIVELGIGCEFVIQIKLGKAAKQNKSSLY